MVDVSVIIPARDAAETIEATLLSLSAQLGRHTVDVVVVDAGSRDGTADVVRSVSRRDPQVRLVSVEPVGPGGARNVGLDEARADWVTFLDADDLWDPGYLASVDEFLQSSGQVVAVCTNIVKFASDGRTSVPQPPLRWRFDHGARVVDISTEPSFLVPNVAGVFFLRDVIEENALRFDPTLTWSEDFDFACRYVGVVDRPLVGVVPRARYYYRASPLGITATAWDHPEKYTVPFERVYLPLVSSICGAAGTVPQWLQHALIYELYWYLHADRAVLHPSARLSAEERYASGAAMKSLAAAALAPEEVASWNAVPLGYGPRALIRLMAAPERTVLKPVTYRPRPLHSLRKVSYFYSGDAPAERVLVDGRPWVPAHAKRVHHSVFSVHLASERILWVPAGAPITLYLDGVEHTPGPFAGEPRRSAPGAPVALSRPTRAWRLRRQLRVRGVFPGAPSVLRLVLRRWSSTRTTGSRNGQPALPGGIWVFHDRDSAADDNAEHLYRHVIQERPGHPVRFLLSARSADWARLAREGFDLVDVDDVDAVAAVWRAAETAFLSDLSSPSYTAAVARGDVDRAGIVFLQHGVTTSDQSRWLNPKRIDLMVTTTADEQRAIVSDGSPYLLTDHEARRTGMPRHDALFRARLRGHGRRDLVLVAPTWSAEARNALQQCDDLPPWEVSPLQRWREIAADKRLLGALEESGRELRYFLHPLLAGYGPRLWQLQDGEIVPATSQDLQDVLARTETVVTDYSSMGVEAITVGARGVRYLPRVPEGVRRLGREESAWPGPWATVHDREALVDALVQQPPRGASDQDRATDVAALIDGNASARLMEVIDQGFVLDEGQFVKEEE